MNYYPFGMPMPNRTYSLSSSSKYRFGFGGHENDDEVKGSGNHLSFGDYGYDPRIGRRFNVDPLSEKFPDFSPYIYCLNNPLVFIDRNGLAPTPFPKNKLGAADYYTWRYNDFMKQNPGMKAPDYYLNYGNKYIQRFTNETNKLLSKEGKKWLTNARLNLQVAIENKLKSDPTIETKNNGKDFKDFAFNSNVEAYWNAGLQKVNTVDLVAIVLTPNFKDLTSEDGMKQAKEMMGKLANYWINNPEEGLKRGAELLLNRSKIEAMVTAKAVREGVDPDKAIPILDKILEQIPTVETKKK